MPKGVPSAADHDLARQLAERGVTVRGKPVSPEQIQRWRRARLLPPVTVSHSGRRGKTSNYPPDALEVAIDAARILEHARALDAAVLTAFGSGRNPDWQTLKQSYRRINARYDKQLLDLNASIETSQARLSRMNREMSAWYRHWLDPDAYADWHQATVVESRLRRSESPADDRETTRTVKNSFLADAITAMSEGASAEQILSSAGFGPLIKYRFDLTDTEFASALDFRFSWGDDYEQRLEAHTYQTLQNARRFVGQMLAILSQFATVLLGERQYCDHCTNYLVAIFSASLKPVVEYPEVTAEDHAKLLKSVSELSTTLRSRQDRGR